MMHYEFTATIARPVDEVFEFLSDFAALPTWQAEFREVEPVTEGPRRTGSVFRYVRKLPVGMQKGTMELTDYEPGVRYAWRALPGPVLPRGEMRFRAVDGGCEVHEVFEAEVRGPLRFLTPLLRRQFSKDAGSDLRAAKRLLEDRAGR